MECFFCLARRSTRLSTPSAITRQTRSEATLRRTKTALRIPPHPSFAQSKDSSADHIIFNPPSSAPNEYHTPLIFMPQSDPRRKLHHHVTTSVPTPSASHLPPPVRKPYEKKYHLTQRDVDELRRLRALDPKTWTVAHLADKFQCSQLFVRLCASAPEAKKAQDEHIDAVKPRWGREKCEAREDRQTRKNLWGRSV